MGTMYMGYHFEEGKKVGYDINVGNLMFHHVSYKTKGSLIYQLKRDGYKEEDININRVEQ